MTILSIITITKDDPSGLKETLFSIRNLKKIFKNEIQSIVIDGSKKSNREENRIISKIYKSEYKIREPTGVSDAFNTGLSISKGEWVWFLNAGDEYNATQAQVPLIAYLQATYADVIIGEIIARDRVSVRPPIWALWPPSKNWIPHPATIIRRKKLVEAKAFSTEFKIAMDGDLWHRLIDKNIIVDLISIPLVKFDVNGLSSNLKSVEIEMKAINRRYFWKNIKHLLGNLYRYVRDIVYYKLE